MYRKLIPIILTSFICVFGRCTNGTTVDKGTSNLTPSDLEGHWKFVTVRIAEDTLFLRNYPAAIVGEQLIQLPYKGPDLIFENDSLFVIDYPIAFDRKLRYSVSSGYLHHHLEERNAKNSYPIKLVGDTLFIYTESYDGHYLKEGYVKTTFDENVLDMINKNGANYPELAGTWSLVRAFSHDDGSEGWELDFPYEIPDLIKISRKQLETSMKENYKFMMSTDGKMRDYVLSYEMRSIKLTPGAWYKGEDPWIHFDRWEEGE